MGLRKIYKPQRDQADGSLPIELGGTAAHDAYHAAENLNLASSSQIDQPLGMIGLDSNNLIDPNSLSGEISSSSLPALFGPIELPLNGTAVYHITNYDSFFTYVITVSGGTMVRDEDRITFTSGNVEMIGGITINDKNYPITIRQPVANRPTIISPLNGSVASGSSIDVISSNFSSPVAIDAHFSSDWELATDSGFTNIIQSSYGDLVNLISWPLMDNAVLTSYLTSTNISRITSYATTYLTSSVGAYNTSESVMVNTSSITSYSTVVGQNVYATSYLTSSGGSYATSYDTQVSGGSHVTSYTTNTTIPYNTGWATGFNTSTSTSVYTLNAEPNPLGYLHATVWITSYGITSAFTTTNTYRISSSTTSYSTSDVSYGVTSHMTSDAGSSYTSRMTTVNNYSNTSYSTSSTTTLITSHETTGSISANTSNATSNETAAVTTYSTSNLTEYPQ